MGASNSTSGNKGKEKLEDHPFYGLAPSPSPSVPNSTKKDSYDVFINHCGKDVKATLANDLYGLLTGEQLSVFLDKEELESGGYFPQALVDAMNSALVHIAIFSDNYADSPWCLAELSHMLKSGAPVVPIFYKVDPSDLRYIKEGKGKYVKAFNKYVEKHRYPGRLEEWKTALKVVSFYTGKVLEDGDDEFSLLKDIVESVLLKIKQRNVPLTVADHPVGMEELVKKFEMNTIQSVEGDHGGSIIGIWGMGGLGKTTLAKELYNRKSSLFHRSCIVYNVRDGGLVDKQKKILRDTGIEENIGNIEEGKEKLSSRLRSVKALIVLDDVDHVNQLEALLPTRDRLASGSLVIVTTRERSVLDSGSITCIYKMEALNPLDATELFCWYAFEQVFSWDGFEGLVEKFVNACHRVPLSLKVIGREIYKEPDKKCWESLLREIGTTLPTDIQQTLKISYDSLSAQEKEMFLDVSCFFIGENSSWLIEIWDGLECCGHMGLKRLVKKCLLEIDDKDSISMHDHLRDMGRSIAKNQSPYRIWRPQPTINVQNQQEGKIGIQGIIATSYQMRWTDLNCGQVVPAMCEKSLEVDNFKVSCSHRKLMVNTNCGIWPLSPSLIGLKFLVISGDSFNQIMGEVSKELVWLRWFEIGQRNFPSELSLKNLRVLEIYEDFDNHLEELWGDGEAPVQLRELFVSDCRKFQGFPKSIGLLSHLRKIIIFNSSITSLPDDEFCLLRSLEHLVITSSEMQSLPINFGNLSSLQYLDLSYSCQLSSLPGSFKNLKHLRHLNLAYCSQLTFTPEDLNCLQKLEYLNLYQCNQLQELPPHIANNVSLRELDFRYTSVRELPDNIGQLSRLIRMDIHNLPSRSLPTSLGGLYSLTHLSVDGCHQIEYLPVSLGDLSSLTNLQISDCPKLEFLPGSLGDLSSLTNLQITICPKLKCLPDSLGGLSSLTNLDIFICQELESVPESLGDLSSLTNLAIVDCPKLEHEEVQISVSKSIKHLSNLQSLRISNCPISGSSLSFGSSSLQSMQVSGTEVCRISFSEDCCTHLESLDIFDNHYLEEIEGLPSTLEIILLENCEMLKKMSSFARLFSLRIFKLQGWNRIEKIDGLEHCTILEELKVETRMEVPGIESLERLQNVMELVLGANKGAVIERCIQRMQKWPRETIIWARAVNDAASLVEPLLSPNLEIVGSIFNRKIQSRPTLVLKPSSNGEAALMICFVVNCVSSQTTLQVKHRLRSRRWLREAKLEQGRWAWVVVFPQLSSNYFDSDEEYIICSKGDRGEENDVAAEEDVVEKGIAVMGEVGTLVEAFRSLLPLLFQS